MDKCETFVHLFTALARSSLLRNQRDISSPKKGVWVKKVRGFIGLEICKNKKTGRNLAGKKSNARTPEDQDSRPSKLGSH